MNKNALYMMYYAGWDSHKRLYCTRKKYVIFKGDDVYEFIGERSEARDYFRSLFPANSLIFTPTEKRYGKVFEFE